MKKHNGIISLWKFLFCMMIVIYHADNFAGKNEHIFLSKGAIGVEFFFLVSGYLLAKSALNKKEPANENLGKETINFIYKKIKAFFPFILISHILGLIVKGYYYNFTIKNYILSIFDLLLLRMAGFKETVINGATWYISAMLICMLVIYPLIRKYKYNYLYIVAPLIVILIGGYMNHNFHSLRAPDLWLGGALGYKGLIRAFIELHLGSILYIITEKVKKINFTSLGKIFITIVEITGFIIPFYMSEFIEKATNYDYVMLIILSISIILAFSEKTLELKFLNNKFIYYLERLSLSTYICHIIVRAFVEKSPLFANYSYNAKLSIYLVIVLILSNAILFIVNKLREKKFYINKIEKLFISSKA